MGALPQLVDELLPAEMYPVTLYSDELEDILDILQQALADEQSLAAHSGLQYAVGVLSAALAKGHTHWRRGHPSPSLLRRVAVLLGKR